MAGMKVTTVSPDHANCEKNNTVQMNPIDDILDGNLDDVVNGDIPANTTFWSRASGRNSGATSSSSP